MRSLLCRVCTGCANHANLFSSVVERLPWVEQHVREGSGGALCRTGGHPPCGTPPAAAITQPCCATPAKNGTGPRASSVSASAARPRRSPGSRTAAAGCATSRCCAASPPSSACPPKRSASPTPSLTGLPPPPQPRRLLGWGTTRARKGMIRCDDARSCSPRAWPAPRSPPPTRSPPAGSRSIRPHSWPTA